MALLTYTHHWLTAISKILKKVFFGTPYPTQKDNQVVLGVECPNTYFKIPCILEMVLKVARFRMAVARPYMQHVTDFVNHFMKRPSNESITQTTNFNHWPAKVHSDPKKETFRIFNLIQFWRLDFTFSHVFLNQNYEPDSSSHTHNTHLESKLP